MLKFEFEPHFIDIYHKFDKTITATVPAGVFVMKKDADTVTVSDGTKVWGLLAQNVHVNPGPEYALVSNDNRAYAGDQVGIYVSPGMFWTDQFVGTPQPGDTLYVTSEGKLTATKAEDNPTASAGVIAVGKAAKTHNGQLLFVYNPCVA